VAKSDRNREQKKLLKAFKQILFTVGHRQQAGHAILPEAKLFRLVQAFYKISH
jgi:hypothetical protein